MSLLQVFRGVLSDPRSDPLADRVARVRPVLPLDDELARAVANWVAHDRTTSRLAVPVAEPYLHGRLEQAAREGRSYGMAECRALWWPATVAVLAVAIAVLVLT